MPKPPLLVRAPHHRRTLVSERTVGPVVGAIDARALLRAYRRAVRMQTRPLAPIGEGLEAVQFALPPESPLAGERLAEAKLPPGARILVFTRQGETSVPSGDTELQAGGLVTIALPAGRRDAVLKAILGPLSASDN